MNTFLLFCLDRTGSESLAHAMNKHPEVRCAIEPFNRNTPLGADLPKVVDSTQLREVLTFLWKSFNGIKHIFLPSGFPFGDPNLNLSLATMPNQRVVILDRKNVLRRLVSSYMSMQARIWHLQDQTESQRYRQFRFEPIDPEWIRSRLSAEGSLVSSYFETIRMSVKDCLRLSYEDIYPDSDPSGQTGAHVVSGLLGHLGFSQLNQAVLEQVIQCLSFKRMNSAETYERIPNIREIDAEFGSDDTGWIF